MDIKQIKWDRVKNVIGRFTRTETHAGQITYSLTSELDDPFVITHFTVDLEDETISNCYHEEVYGPSTRFELTREEIAEARQMIKDIKRK